MSRQVRMKVDYLIVMTQDSNFSNFLIQLKVVQNFYKINFKTAMFNEIKSKDHVYDVIIIGSGISGLSAGLWFKDCGVKNIVVLEARDRVGGRLCTEKVALEKKKGEEDKKEREDKSGSNKGKWINETYVDAGGAYVGPTQTRLLRMAKRYNIKTYKINTKGNSLYYRNGKSHSYTGTIPYNAGIFTLLDINHLLNTTDALANKINDNMKHKDKTNYDEITVKQWMEANSISKDAQNMYSTALRTVLCVEPSEVSMLSWLAFVKSSQGMLRMIETDNGAQERKFIGGTQNICQQMKFELDTIHQVSEKKRPKMWLN
ncbi:monoamine oxidase B-like protein [Reticulomyxa filosa]|uniref:monoamine oxidase n=1 Tax=Reticulomyxa filosa TaxID=46433 RepID=X6PFW3_RETFI|nr:monoamine oxidase B-like protein [Reticulomyxa filosa]|eukprot:ETO36993.1 monoamine oxidase B-like protein [Reticulomyxa filosa]